MKPDTNIFVSESGEHASASLWFKDDIVIIGEFVAENFKAVNKLFEIIEQKAKENNCKKIIGPMNENTWNNYRFVSWKDNTPQFFLEEINPLIYNDFFTLNNFKSCAKYYSTIQDIKPTEKNNIDGITFKHPKLKKTEDFLETIYNLSIVCFKDNPYYSEISKEDFIEKYSKIIPLIRTNLILIAEKDKEPIGFMFAIPNYNDKSFNTIIMKTIAVLPEYQGLGIGKEMFNRVLTNAHKKGYKQAISAYMYQNNVSINLPKDSKKIREYTLYEKNLKE